MAWDDASNTLYAASSCHYIDRNGRHMDYYRMAKIPVQAEDPNTAQIGEDEERFEEESEDICWPKDAYYAEDYFGHAFDAGDHRICKLLPMTSKPPSVLILLFKINSPSRRTPILRGCPTTVVLPLAKEVFGNTLHSFVATFQSFYSYCTKL